MNLALSGVFSKSINTRWRLQVEWSASQSIGGNYSDVTVRFYWIGEDQYSAVYSSASDPVSITINGNTSTGSATAGLDANQKKLIHTHKVRVNHNDDGTKSFTLSAYFDLNVTLNSTSYGRESLSDSIILNTIPRKSTLASSANLSAGHNKTMSIKRASSSFRHEIEIYVKNRAGADVHVKHMELAAGDTSQSTDFSFAQTESI